MRKETVVPKTSSRWEQFLLFTFSQAKAKDWDVLALSSRQMSRITSKGLIVLGLVSLWWWNWQLLLATSTGIGLMWLTYKMSHKQYRRLWQRITGSVAGYNGRLLFAVGSGSLGGLVTYMIAGIWADAENRWLATGSILQGLGTLITLILLGWHINRESSQRHEAKFEQLLGDLTAENSLKRLIAIRQLTNLGHQKALNREQQIQLIEYFHFMLAQSPETSIQEALLDSLDMLGVSNFALLQSQPVATPIKLKHSV